MTCDSGGYGNNIITTLLGVCSNIIRSANLSVEAGIFVGSVQLQNRVPRWCVLGDAVTGHDDVRLIGW